VGSGKSARRPFRAARLRWTGRVTVSSPKRSLAALSSVQIQPTNVRTRKGYAKKGRGELVGNTCAPQNILAAVMANRIEPIMLMRRTQIANSLGTLVSRRAADHKALPAANEGTVSARVELEAVSGVTSFSPGAVLAM
jgi:hypothetical protein